MVKVIEKLKNHRRKDPGHTMPAVFRILLSALFLIFLAMIFTWYTFWRVNMNNSEAVDKFIEKKTDLFLYSYAIITLVMLLVAAITWRPFLTAALMFAAINGITYAHVQKFTLRQTPLFPEDLQMAGQVGGLMEFVDTDEVTRMVIGIVFIIVGAIIAERCARRVFGHKRSGIAWWERWSLVPRITLSLIAATVLVLVASPVVREKSQGENAIGWIKGIDLVGWNQNDNYNKNGFVIGFLYNLGALKAETPTGYSKERVAEIIEKYEKMREADETRREPLSDVVDNLIFVMNESFYDPELLSKVYAHSGGDVVPNLHKIFQKYPSGYMYSPEYGGNTANVEFAAFTSLSNYWSGSIPYVNSVSKISSMPGMVSLAVENGFSPIAIHAYDGKMYKRDAVYKNMGFSEFLDWDKMKYTQLADSRYISDESVYKEILDVLNDGEKKHMVGAITMQNHTPYVPAYYNKLDFPLLKPRDNQGTTEASFQILNSSDKYLGDFIKELDKVEGRTVMIWFGDHAAGVLDDLVNSDDKKLRDLAHLTPYFIYANFDLENTLTEKEVAALNREIGFSFKTKGVDLPTVTPNCLANILYDVLGVEKPTLLYLVNKVCEETPVLAPSYFADEKLEMTEELQDYWIINYDTLNGKRYWLE